MSSNTNILINRYDNNLYELLYISLQGKINRVKKELWMGTNKFDATGSNVTELSPNIIASKITQLNTGEFLFLGKDCNVYKMSSDFTAGTLLNDTIFLYNNTSPPY